MSDPFLAEIVMIGAHYAPKGWALCNGQLLPINQYRDLYDLIGTTYGGDGQTTFALPDLRGRFSMHPGDGPNLTSRTLGQKGGQEYVLLTAQQIPQHNHGINVLSTDGDTGKPKDHFFAGATAASGDTPYNATKNATMAADMMGYVGSNQQHTNMQPFKCVNYIISLQGLTPSRN